MQKLTFPNNIPNFWRNLTKWFCWLNVSYQHWNHIPGLLDSKISHKERRNKLKDIQNVKLLWYGDYSSIRVFHPAPTRLNPWRKNLSASTWWSILHSKSPSSRRSLKKFMHRSILDLRMIDHQVSVLWFAVELPNRK